jgi:glycosyltransferase involved in cell wall biosynthesis
LKPKIAAVVQRYGCDVVGGETLCRQVMEHLSDSCDITVLTSCARDYTTWANFYPQGEHLSEGVKVIRFPSSRQRPPRLFRALSGLVLQKKMPGLSPPSFLQKLWILMQGPHCRGLLEYLRLHRSEFDAFIFYTYLYYPTVFGLPLVKERSILVPTAHDERPIHLPIYREVFESARSLIFLTPEERRFVNQTFRVSGIPQRIASMGIPCLTEDAPCPERIREFKERIGISCPYFLFLGRADPAKGTEKMFSYFLRFLEETGTELVLLLAGERQASLPESPAIRHIGFLSETDKQSAIAGCESLLLFSPYESLSISLLEAMGMGKPVIVEADTAVLKGHVTRSGSGFAVERYEDFRSASLKILMGSCGHLKERGIRYVSENYDWDSILGAYLDSILEVRR